MPEDDRSSTGYIGTFMDVKGQLHTLQIGSGSLDTDAMVFSGEPFKTSMDASEDLIYKPARYSSATIGLLAIGDRYFDDLYTGDAREWKVRLSDSQNRTEWLGYITPSLYSIGYTRKVEDLQIDCIDGLSVLQYYKYKPIDGTPGIHSIVDIVRHCLKQCRCYTYLVHSVATAMLANYQEVVANGMISESCFVSAKEDDDHADTMTYQEVLENICQWLGMTIFAEGDDVWMVDYDVLRAAADSHTVVYKKVLISDGTITTLSSSSFAAHNITGASYATSDTHLSLDNVYSKVSVVDDMDTFDAVITDFFEDAENITVEDPEVVMDTWNGQVGEYVTGNDGDNMLAIVRAVDGVQNSDAYNAIFIKYYKSPYYKFYRYVGGNNLATTQYDDEMNYTDTREFNGAVPVRVDVEKLEDTSFISQWLQSLFDQETDVMSLDEVLAANEISSIRWKDYIFMLNHQDNHIPNSAAESKPYFETTTTVTPTTFFGGANAYLVIQGTVYWHMDNDSPYPIPDGEVDPDHGRRTINPDDAHLLCKLQWGSQYWDGSTWQGLPKTFKVPFAKERKRTDAVCFKAMPIINTVSWRIGTDEQGYLIPMPQSGAILGSTPKLTVYKPMDFSVYYNTLFMALEDFRITPIVADPTFSGESDTDTIYTNVLNANNVNELDDLSYKVCTYDGKNPNYNSVACARNGEYYYVDTVRNSALASLATGTIRYDGSVSDGTLRQEEMMVLRITNQYTEPAKVLELTLHDNIRMNSRNVAQGIVVYESNLDTYFVVDKVDRDYKAQTFTYRLIEKK